MNELFNTRMAEFESRDRLQKETTSSTSPTSLEADFSIFKKFVIQALNDLQQQVQILAQSADNLETRSRRKMLLFHGVPEEKNEDVTSVANKLLSEQCKLSGLSTQHLKRSQRLGRVSSSGKPRPILVKFQQVTTRDSVWYAKTNLKGTGITISEFLTKCRHEAFMCARQRFGVTRCWTREGVIHVTGPDEKRHRITTLRELYAIKDNVVKPVAAAKATVIKTRRAAKKIVI